MNELLAIVRDATSDRSDDAWLYVAHRARWYAKNGVTKCNECGAVPERHDLFTPLMPCGHPWTSLWWIPNPGVVR